MVDVSSVGEAISPVGLGPKAQFVVPQSFLGALSVPAAGSVVSDVLPSGGFTAIAIGITSTQAGQLSVQRYLDSAGTIPAGAASTVALVANTAEALTINDGAIFRSFVVTVSNSGGAAATLSKFIVVQQA